MLIDRLGQHGDGISEDGVWPGGLPGDEVKNGGLVPTSPHRQDPPCSHFGTCGGCLLQHASDAFLAQWKQDEVARQLSTFGLESPIRSIKTSPPQSRRRATFAGRRTKKTVVLGFHGRRSDEIVPIRNCHLVVPEISDAFPTLRNLTRLSASRKGSVRIAVTTSHAGLDVAISDARNLDVSMMQSVVEAAQSLARLTWNDELVFQNAPPYQIMGTAEIVPPAGGFLQATQEGETALRTSVIEAIGDARHITDLFAGCGTFALPLTQQADVHAVEGDAEMCKAMLNGWRAAGGLRPLRVTCRDLFQEPLTPAELKTAAVILDPPRAGAARQSAEISKSSVPVIAMVSCNPASFARDTATLVKSGYRLDWIDVVDQFRWSPHIELVAKLARV